MSRERRELPRAPLSAVVAEELYSGFESARAMDICELGMRYRKPLDAETPKDNEVFLHFNLPGDDRPIRVLGCVANEERCGLHHTTSVTFAFLGDEDAQRIRNYVQKAAA